MSGGEVEDRLFSLCMNDVSRRGTFMPAVEQEIFSGLLHKSLSFLLNVRMRRHCSRTTV